MMGTFSSMRDLPYRAIYAVDAEFFGDDADPKTPVCLVVRNLHTGEFHRYWQDELSNLSRAPFDTGPEALFVAFYSSAELGVFKQLGWSMPERIFDCYVEFVCETNGQQLPAGKSLLGAMAFFGQNTIGAEAKEDMRSLILSGGPWSETERVAILDYCQSDVDALARLFPTLIETWIKDELRLGQALLRGRYMAAVACIEHIGIPLDVDMVTKLRDRWHDIKTGLIAGIDEGYGVFEGGSFKESRFETYLTREGIPWPRLPSGRLALDRDTFRTQKNSHPKLTALYELRVALDELRLNALGVGKDGRNRAMLSPFRSKTSRNQPSTSKFIFGSSAWVRGFIRPAPGFSIAYIDWKSQEIAVAAARSGDEAMWAASETGDPYMAFSIQAGLAPPGATKATHRAVRDRCKTIVLGLQYGMTPEGMCQRSDLLLPEAQDLVRRHKETYRTFWIWAEQNAAAGLFGLPLQTCFGWKIRTGYGTDPKERTFLNWPMQANAAEMLRLACCLATEAGLRICAPIHDALLLEATTDRIHEDVERLKGFMQTASELVLGTGKYCGVDVQIVHYPDRFRDERGTNMWARVTGLLEAA
jgi:DNA polymerase-1